MVKNPEKWPRSTKESGSPQKNLMDWSLDHAQPLQKCHKNSFWRCFLRKKWSHTDRHNDIQTDPRTESAALLLEARLIMMGLLSDEQMWWYVQPFRHNTRVCQTVWSRRTGCRSVQLIDAMLLSTAGDECPSGYGLCDISTIRLCIPESWFCDGDNDCGDMSDENPAECRKLIITTTDTTTAAATTTSTNKKPCCRKETAPYRSCSFRFKVRRQHSLNV